MTKPLTAEQRKALVPPGPPSPQAQHALDVQREWREAAERDRGK